MINESSKASDDYKSLLPSIDYSDTMINEYPFFIINNFVKQFNEKYEFVKINIHTSHDYIHANNSKYRGLYINSFRLCIITGGGGYNNSIQLVEFVAAENKMYPLDINHNYSIGLSNFIVDNKEQLIEYLKSVCVNENFKSLIESYKHNYLLNKSLQPITEDDIKKININD